MDRVIVVPFRTVFDKPRSKRARCAVKFTREFIERHTKKKVKLSAALNKAIIGDNDGIPRRLRVLIKDEKEFVLAKLEGEKEEVKKEKKPAKTEAPKEVKKEIKEKTEVKKEEKGKKDDKGGKG